MVFHVNQGSVGPVSTTTVLAESGPSGQVHLLSTSVSHLPDRPDQPECRHFMSTGSCRYGSDCKYHHPREKFAQLASNSLGPFGLPLRPGQPVCPHYHLYGLCKYGPTCKFDHPSTGYSYGYNWNLSTVPVVDPSSFSYQRNPAFQPFDTAPSKSSKVAEWIRKSDAASKEYRNPDTTTSEDSPEHTGSPTNSLPNSELPHDQSD
ncbi:unnamed protein product [Ilex paraguariensis]|uniref:C3H1-type domain-containing protein n=1 Tax=Ilex paraguariensis TaxID=185542 RepID=A0ABC8USU6_9AQUA